MNSENRNLKLYLVDGTFELFRAYFSHPSSQTSAGHEVGAVRGLLRSTLALLSKVRVTHIAFAFDHVIESFRNEMFCGYKTSAAIAPDLLNQFHLAEEAVSALGITVWPMTEFEADDAIASAARRFQSDEHVDQIIICSPDKDFAQIIGGKVRAWDRIRDIVIDENAVLEKFGIHPASIPDWLALVGDQADGIPGIARWGKKSASTVLAKFHHLENIPSDFRDWQLKVRGASHLSENLMAEFDKALLYRELATLRQDVPLQEDLGDIQWCGARREAIEQLSRILEISDLAEQIKAKVAFA